MAGNNQREPNDPKIAQTVGPAERSGDEQARVRSALDDADRASGRYAYDGLQRVIHERCRLGILSSLAGHSAGLLFTDLKALCNLTDGNLSRQLQLLQETGFVQITKGFRNNRPQTWCQLTDSGRERFLEYIGVLENVVADAMGARQSARENAEPRPGPTVSPA